MSDIMKNEQLGPQDKNFAFLGVFHWGLQDRKGQKGLECIPYYQNVGQKTNKQSHHSLFTKCHQQGMQPYGSYTGFSHLGF